MLENQEARVGASYKAVMRVPHGCDGSAATAVRIRIPEGIVAVKPMPKLRWVSECVTEVRWSAGNWPDPFYDEFVFPSASRRVGAW
jgi:uncharacterized protein YcnI